MACTCGPNEGCSECPQTYNGTFEYQRRIVNELQKRVLKEAGTLPPGQLRDLATALAMAVDKMQSLGGSSVRFTNS